MEVQYDVIPYVGKKQGVSEGQAQIAKSREEIELTDGPLS